MCLLKLILRNGFHVSFLTSIIVSILRVRKVEFSKWLNLINILLIWFVKFEITQWFSAYQDQFCVWFYSLARLPTARVFFLSLFLRKKRFIIFLLPARLSFPSLFNASTMLFCTYLMPNHVKYYLNSQNMPPPF